MALREELEQSGNWLFRWRSYLPLVLIVPLILAMRDPMYRPTHKVLPYWWGLLCMGISFGGLAIRIVTVARAGTNVRPEYEARTDR